MRDTLVVEIAELERQISGYTDQLEQTEYGTAKHVAIKDELDKTQSKLSAKQESLAEIDGAANNAQEELFILFDNIEIDGYPFTLRDFTADESKHQLLYGWLMEREGNTATLLHSYKAEAAETKARIAELQAEMNTLKDEKSDLEQKRDAAANEIQYLKTENGRLTADNESLRKKLESTVKPSDTNNNTDMKELARQEYLKKPAIYGKRWEDDLKRTSYIAHLAETGEEIVIPRLELGKYRELSEEDAARFRAELDNQKAIEAAETARMVEEANNNTTLVVPKLPSEATPDRLDESDTGLEMAGQTVSRKEFDQLAARVAYLEQSAVAVA